MSKKVIVPSQSEILDQFKSQLRRTITNPTVAGYRPLPEQKRFHASKAKGKVALGGNRAGKTVVGATEMVLRMIGEHPNQKKKPPLACRAIGSSFEDGIKKIIQPEIKKWLPPSQLKDGSWEKSYDLSSRTLTLENGSTLEFLTYDQDVQKHAGTSRDCIWFDEEPPEEIFNENLVRLVDVGGEWWLTMTPLLDMSWTYERLYQAGLTGSNPDIEIFQLDTLDNIYIDVAILEILLAGMEEEEKEARKHGTYYNLSGGIYSSTLSHDNFIDPIIGTDLWDLYYHKWDHFGMLDHGYTNPTAFHLGCVDEEGRIVIYYEYRATKKLVKENAEEIIRILEKLKLTDRIQYIVADPSIRNTDPINGSSIFNEYHEEGVDLILGNNDVRAGISRINAMLKDNTLLVTSNNRELVLEFPQYRWAKFVSSKIASRKNPQEMPIKKNDHSLDALRYGVMSRPSKYSNQLEEPVGNVLNVNTAINADERIDLELMVPYSQWDNPKIFDDVLGTDW